MDELFKHVAEALQASLHPDLNTRNNAESVINKVRKKLCHDHILLITIVLVD